MMTFNLLMLGACGILGNLPSHVRRLPRVKVIPRVSPSSRTWGKFLKMSLGLSDSGDEDDVILEICVEEEQIKIVVLPNSPNPFFYLEISVVQDLGVLIPFTMFKAEVLATANVAPSQILSNGWDFIRAFKIM
ncbi:hypothetical protein KIW84_062376 [Lathyrus oleraceus]|uniref:Uncharacterized protein n=1 Tax=Pisum sativum TaxID=3888 RepID=A0A9D4W6X8_PEA|nr:hypothetical protein KIW84_062376 [Pisum sativum]